MTTTISYDEIVVFASYSDCLQEAPIIYKHLMHYLHILTMPLYTISIYVLVFKTPLTLREYRKYLLWHTLGNLIFEVYVSILFLPVTYLPYLVFRGTGLLKYLDISGLVQFYLLVSSLIHTGLSIMEMFKYRFDATISDDTLNKKILHKIVIFFWVIAIIIPVLGFITLPRCIPHQNDYKQNVWKSAPNVSIEVVCSTSVAAPPLIDPVFTPLMTLIITAIVTAAVIVPHTTLTILAKLEQLSKHLSRRTIEMQKMLLISLFIQAAIHGLMLGAPVGTFVYAIIFSLDNNGLAYFLLLLISFHGSISTVAMIAFTKPIRLGVLKIFGSILPEAAKDRILIFVSPPSTEISRTDVSSRNSIIGGRKSIY